MQSNREWRQRLARVFDVGEAEIPEEMLASTVPPPEDDWISLITTEVEFGA